MTALCLILSAVTLAGALAAMTFRRLVHSALALTIAFAGLAALYIALDAEFAGLAQLLIYVGAIAILIVFAILLTPGAPEAEANDRPLPSFSDASGILLALAVFAVLATAILRSHSGANVPGESPAATVRQIGEALLRRYILPLELLGLMLTAALIGAVILAMKESQSPR
jgi:NADH-quinone oxidoreductase subunit J